MKNFVSAFQGISKLDLMSLPWFPPALRAVLDLAATTFCGLVASQWAILLHAETWIKRGWLYESIEQLEHEVFLINVLFGASLYLLFRAAFVKWLSMLLSVTVSLSIAIISLEKVRQIEMPLLPWDLWFAREIDSFLKFSSIDPIKAVVIASGIALSIALLVRLRVPFLRRSGFLLALVTGLLPITIWSTSVATGYVERLSRAGIHNITWDQRANFNNYGPYYTFLSNWRFMSMEKPEPAEVRSALQVDSLQSDLASIDSVSQPDVVTILSESFTTLPKKIFGLPFTCLNDSVLSELITPAWGGLTANVEFELLTGYPHAVFPTGSIPYQMYLKRPVAQALPRQFAAAGFEASAVHTYARSFFSRPKAYEMLGFSRYDGVEDLKETAKIGYYVRDDVLFDEILRRLDAAGDQPNFIHAVTMMAHQPYGRAERYPVSERVDKALPKS